ncbi:MAG: hypothetical protein WAM90_08340 [Rhodanobacter sp.]
MSNFVPMVATIMLLATSFCLAQVPGATSPKLECDIGPIPKTFGNSQWRVYSCSDGRSVVVVSAPGSPAVPFYFMFQATASGHHLIGEGTGKKAATDEAYGELKGLSEQGIEDLIRQTKSVKR